MKMSTIINLKRMKNIGSNFQWLKLKDLEFNKWKLSSNFANDQLDG
jgi:hypothetical protein